MPYRSIPLVEGEIYHTFNRSVASEPIFTGQQKCQRFLEVVDFYRYKKPRIRFSHYNQLELQARKNFLADLYKTGQKLVEILAFAIMSNHFHFLLRQKDPKGISNFLRNVQDSYAKYINTKTSRTGALFRSMFKAIRIESDEQFLHVARYIHLNPFLSYLLKEKEQLEIYPWTSYKYYLEGQDLPLLEKNTLLSYFKSIDKLRAFTMDQAEYQRGIDRIKHLLLE